MDDSWENPYEEDGLTLGPEQALLRETEKTKALKVERLQLKDTIEKLQSKNESLAKVNQALEKKLIPFPKQSSSKTDTRTNQRQVFFDMKQTNIFKWAYLLLIFNLTSLTILIISYLKQ
jgi:hypothetical protein